jgi:hypothetical protein
VSLLFFYFITINIYISSTEEWQHKQEKKITQDIYPGKTTNGGKTQQPFLDRFHSQRKSQHINPRSTINITTTVATTLHQDSTPPQGVTHKREIPKD